MIVPVLAVLFAAVPPARVCETPDCLLVTSVHSEKGKVTSIGVGDTRLHVYVWVPQGTERFTLSVFDQTDDVPGAAPSRFVLYAPDGAEARTLDVSRAGAWSDYPVAVGGRWGVWRLSVTGPEDAEGAGARKAENAFRVRTTGAVDLYLKPEPVARVRGLRLGAPLSGGGGGAARFTLQMPPGAPSLRVNLLRPAAVPPDAVSLVPAAGQAGFSVARGGLTAADDDRLPKGTALSTLDLTGSALSGLWTLSLPAAPAGGYWGVGTDREARLFCLPAGATPLTPAPVATPVVTEGGAAHVTVTSPRTANERVWADTGADGRATLALLPGAGPYTVTATRGFAFGEGKAEGVTPGRSVALVPARALGPMPGWYAGDTHCHTAYYDGTVTPAQTVAAARAEGLDWLFITEHGHSDKLARAEAASREALAVTGGPLVIPGMEYTGPEFHANVLGGFVRLPAGASLGAVLGAAPPGSVVALNHPTIGKTAAGMARAAADRLPLVELWNSPEPAATALWWELLNTGHRVFAETGSDSHHREGAPPGYRRTYIYLGEGTPLTAANVVRALREGRSFLSRGATLDVTFGGERPGGTARLAAGEALSVRLSVRSVRPVGRIDLVHGGRVVRTLDGAGKTRFDGAADLPAAEPGWYLAQVWEQGAKEGDAPLAMSNPVWVETKP